MVLRYTRVLGAGFDDGPKLGDRYVSSDDFRSARTGALSRPSSLSQHNTEFRRESLAESIQWRRPESSTALALFNSGTTGPIKAAEISHAAQLARLDAWKFVASPQVVGALHTIGIYHISGQMLCNRACAGKLHAHLSTADDAITILDRIQSSGITVVTLPPRTMEAITAAIHTGVRSRESLQSIGTVTVGGSPYRKEAVEAFTALLPSHSLLRSSYGSTEAGVVSMTPGDAPWTPGYIGAPLPGVELK